MAITTGIAHGQSTTLEVQARPIANITTLNILDARFIHTNLGPQRLGDVVIEVDGDIYLVRFTFTEEAIDQRTVQGYTKKRNPETSER